MPDRGYAAPDPATPHPPTRHAPAPATPTAVCGCGVRHDLWVSGQGRWHWFCWAVLFPLFTLGLWVLAGAVALLAPDLPTAARAGIGVLPVLTVVPAVVVQRRAGHRGACWLGRSAYLTLAWPGALFAGLAQI